MKKFASCLTAFIVVLALSGSSSKATPVPDRVTGIWSLGDCAAAALTVLVNSTGALVVETEGAAAHVAVVEAEWIHDSFVLTVRGNNDDMMLPPLEQFQRCTFLPPSVSVPFAKAVAVFKRLDKIEAACMGEETNVARCMAVAFDMIDVTGDGLFSHAELSRGLRAAAFFVGYRWAADQQQEAAVDTEATRWPAFVPLEKLYVGQFVGTALGPIVASNLLQSYDYDGDGFLSLAELMHDRVPETGLQGALAKTALQMSPAAVSAFMKSLAAGFNLLQ